MCIGIVAAQEVNQVELNAYNDIVKALSMNVSTMK